MYILILTHFIDEIEEIENVVAHSVTHFSYLCYTYSEYCSMDVPSRAL
jgi:hypothetical protein